MTRALSSFSAAEQRAILALVRLSEAPPATPWTADPDYLAALELQRRGMAACAEPWASLIDWEENHNWEVARLAAKARDGEQCVTCGAADRLQVNHIEPRVGRGYGPGCHNHLTNLETLCTPCHGKVTGAQRRARR